MKHLLLLFACLTLSSLKAAPPSEEYELLFSDEFNGDAVEVADWQFRTDERFHGLNRAENVSVRNGRLVIDFRRETVAEKPVYTSGGVISRGLFGYGYYEVKGRLWGGGAGLHSAFWSMGRDGGDGKKTPRFNQIVEIDGYEVDSHAPRGIHLNVHAYVGRHFSLGGLQGTAYSHDLDTSAEDFVFGYEWLPGQVNWYLNGRLIRELKGGHLYGPQNVWLTALATPRGFAGGPAVEDATLPGQSSWDYFRYYAKPLPGVNLLANGGFEYNIGEGFVPQHTRDPRFPVGWTVGGDPDSVRVEQTRNAFDGNCLLRFSSDKPFTARIRQSLNALPNGDYALTARLRTSGGLKDAKVAISATGANADQTLSLPAEASEKWTTASLPHIPVTSNQCTVELSVSGDANQWLELDDVVLARLPRADIHATEEPRYPGEIFLDTQNAGNGYEENGTWAASSISGHRGNSRYSSDRGAVAQWNPRIPKTGDYRILLHNIAYPSNVSKIRVEIGHSGDKDIKELAHDGTARRWEDLGVYRLAKGADNFVKISRADENDPGLYVRADGVKFLPLASRDLAESLLLKTGSNFAFVNMREKRIDPDNPGLVPFEKDGRIHVPESFILQHLAALSVFEKHKTSADADGSTPADSLAERLGLEVFIDAVSGVVVFSRHKDVFGVPPDPALLAETVRLFPAK